MNRSTQFSSLLIAATATLLALPAMAQSSSSKPDSGSAGSNRYPVPASSSASDTDPGHPGSNKGSVTGSASTDSASGVGKSSLSDLQGSRGFDQLDSDRDGRISLTEYAGSSVVSPGRPPSPGSDMAPSSRADGGIGDESTGRRSDITTVVPGGSQGAQNEELFRQLDRDHDGYLSRSELNASR